MEIENKFDLIFAFGKSKSPQSDMFWHIMKRIEDSFLPTVTKILMPDKGTQPIISARDDKVLKAIKSEKLLELKDDNNLIEIALIPRHRLNMTIAVNRKIIEKTPVNEIIDLFQAIISIHQPVIAEANFFVISKRLMDMYYRENLRTRRSPGLVWLQYFGEEECTKQGGEAIFNNPYLKIEKIGRGILIQVGESPHDAYTPEGEKLLVKATKAMPPVIS